ncbi:hypothetical protein ACJH6H_14825 [Mycobacterium sp. SMC-21]|uniref:hypothetical protein n=1 Tax=Mycobacterium sp. SMC-21 TaxID=3381632 RepID=UPI0038768305
MLGDDHAERWQRMCRDYGTNTRDNAGLADGLQFHTESAAGDSDCPVSDTSVLTFTDAAGSPDSLSVAEFWQSRQVLADLYQFAKSRRCGPWAMLGNVMLRAASAIPPDVVLPPVVGGQASLNLYVAFAGNSGDGKGAATVAADDWLVADTMPYTAEAGSGEGMVKQFAYKQNQRGQPPAQINMRWSVLFDVREIDSLGAISGRNSSTMLPILRSAYSGEALGFSYADPTKAIKLCAHRYRFCMGVGVQPKNAGVLIHDSDGGTPQRYVWLPVLDPDMPDVRPSAPRRLTLRNWQDVAPKKKLGKNGAYTLVAGADHTALLDTESRSKDRTEIEVPEHIWVWLDRQRVEHNRGTKRIDALDAHANQTRLKVAAILMWLDGRTDKITDDDWRLSGAVMAVSVLTRKWIEQKLAAKADAAQQSIGRNQAVRDRAASEAKSQMESDDIERVAAKIIRLLGEAAEPVARWKLTQKIAARDRHLFDDAVGHLVDTERVRKIDTKRSGETIGYKLALIDAS